MAVLTPLFKDFPYAINAHQGTIAIQKEEQLHHLSAQLEAIVLLVLQIQHHVQMVLTRKATKLALSLQISVQIAQPAITVILVYSTILKNAKQGTIACQVLLSMPRKD